MRRTGRSTCRRWTVISWYAHPTNSLVPTRPRSGGDTIYWIACRAYKVRPAGNLPPDKFETGTQNHEAQAGTLAAVNYLAELGEEFGAAFADRFPGFTGRRLALKQALTAIQTYERPLFKRFVTGLLEIPGLSFYGIRDFDRFDQRTPTAAFRLKDRSPREVEERLSQRGIYVWSGNFHAIAVTERLGLEESGGVVRAGIADYNTQEEVDSA